jgi:AcrR family transcriptional regulator
MIARAAHEVGLDRITMKAVADHLGVSVPGLYHHVDDRDELMRLAAEYSASQIRIPVDHGQHWTEWLMEWARYSYDAFIAQPELLGQFLRGSIGAERIATNVDAVLGLLARQGFSPAEAMDAYIAVSDCAVGAAVGRIRDAEATAGGRPTVAEYHRLLATAPPDELRHLRALLADGRPLHSDVTDAVRTVLIGIAVRRGDPWEPITTLGAPAPTDPAPHPIQFLHP